MRESFSKNFKFFVFFFFVFSFIVGMTVLLVLYSQGKRLSPGEGIKDTGIIRLHVNPQDVDAFINGVKVNISNDMIDSVEPGEVTLMLAKDGYSAWEKTLDVKANLVKDVYAQLFPLTLNFDQLTSSNVDKIFFSNDPSFVFYTTLNSDIPEEIGIWRLKVAKSTIDIVNPKPEKIANLSVTLLELLKSNPNYELIPASDNSKVILKVPNTEALYVYDAGSTDDITDLVPLLGFVPEELYWFKDAESLILKEQNLLVEYDFSAKNMTVVAYAKEDKPIFGVCSDSVYFYDKKSSALFKYANKSVDSVKLPLGLDIQPNFESIVCSYENKDVLIYKAGGSYYFVDLKKAYQTTIAKDITLKSTSDDALFIAYQQGDNFYTFTLEETVDGRSYETKVTTLPQKAYTSLYYSSNDMNLIGYTLEETKLKMWLMDYDGQNPQQVADQSVIQSSNNQVAKNGSELYLLLSDGETGESTTDEFKNIYRLKLETR